MELAIKIALMGGFFAILTMIHFVVDWIFQTHAEAMVKHNQPWVRAKHCAIYTIGFVPFMELLHFGNWEWFIATNILFWSHFFLDTYKGVFLWAKYIRKPPEMAYGDAEVGFVLFIQTTLGKILMIVIDQISHILCLLPIAYMALNKIHINIP
jgi:hypothetical protein